MRLAAALGVFCAGVVCNVAAAQPKLAVERIALHQFEDGPTLDPSYEFLPGETAYFSCRFIGYQTQVVDADRQDAKLSWHMEVRDPLGVLLQEPAEGRIDAMLFPEDTNWMPKFLKSFVVPSFAISGEYRIAVRVRDEIAGSDLAGELRFRVKGYALEQSSALVAQNVVFLSSENDALGTRSTVARPGGMVWARMDVSGYKFGDKNHFSISFGMALENADGKQLFSEPNAGSQADESFYPQRYSTGTLALNLDKGTPAGTYTLVVTVRDTVGDQTVEVRAPFQVQ